MTNKKSNYKTGFLLPNNNFMVGLGNILNIAGGYFKHQYIKSDKDADNNAITSDWKNIGNDFKIANKQAKNNNDNKFCPNL